MKHIRTFYGDAGTLKVGIYHNQKASKYSYYVIVRTKKRSTKSYWKTLNTYRFMTFRQAKQKYYKIMMEF